MKFETFLRLPNVIPPTNKRFIIIPLREGVKNTTKSCGPVSNVRSPPPVRQKTVLRTYGHMIRVKIYTYIAHLSSKYIFLRFGLGVDPPSPIKDRSMTFYAFLKRHLTNMTHHCVQPNISISPID